MTTATIDRPTVTEEIHGGLRIERIERWHGAIVRYESKIWTGKAKTAEWIVFRNADQRDAHIANRKDGWDVWEKMKADRRAAAKAFDATEHFKVGDILDSSWGYDQTNVQFYEVLKVTSGMIWMVEIGQTMIAGSEGFMSESVTADPSTVVDGEVTKHRVTSTSVRIESYQHASKWDGKPKYQSHYA